MACMRACVRATADGVGDFSRAETTRRKIRIYVNYAYTHLRIYVKYCRGRLHHHMINQYDTPRRRARAHAHHKRGTAEVPSAGFASFS